MIYTVYTYNKHIEHKKIATKVITKISNIEVILKILEEVSGSSINNIILCLRVKGLHRLLAITTYRFL